MNNLASDNISGACPEVMEALLSANQGVADSYGEDQGSIHLQRTLSDIFETEVTVFTVATGTAANSLALSALTPQFGKIYCHELAHINTDECGAPEFFTGGAKLVGLQGDNNRIAADTLEAAVYGRGNVHHAQPATVSITQACESGVVYPLDQIQAIANVAKRHQLHLHMDGARFANALVSLDLSPAEMTWRAGVDVLTFGGTKNGCLAAEVVVFFKPELVGNFPYLQKRSGQLLSKMRFISSQLQAYLDDDVWLRNARHANTMAQQFSDRIAKFPGIELAYPTECNEVFARLPDAVVQRLGDNGIALNNEELDGSAVRFVASWNTGQEELDQLLDVIEKQCIAVAA